MAWVCRALLAWLFLSVSAHGAGDASPPAGIAGDLAAVAQGADSLRRWSYPEARHLSTARALTRLAGLGEDELRRAALAASEREKRFWASFGRRGELPREEAVRLASALDAVADAFGSGSPASPAKADRLHPAVGQALSASDRALGGVSRSGAADPEAGEEFWDGGARRGGGAAAPAHAARQGQARPPTRSPADPTPTRAVPTVTAAPAPRASAAPPPVPASSQRPQPSRAEACRLALADHPTAADLCDSHPRLAPLIAGLLEAFRRQFGTVQGVVANLMGLLAGLLISAMSGFGVVARIVMGLVSLGLLSGALYGLIKEGYSAAREYRRAPDASPQSYSALLRLGAAGGSALILALFTAGGVALARTGPAQAALVATRDAMARLGAARAGAAADGLLAAPIKALFARLAGPSLVGAAARSGGRAAEFAAGWPRASLREALRAVAGERPVVRHTDVKTYYTNPKTGVEVIHDRFGNYFRVRDPSVPGSRNYLDAAGSRVPAERIQIRTNGTEVRVPVDKARYMSETHFVNTD